MPQPFAKRFYKSKEWQKIRAYVFERDKGLCQECLSKGLIQAGEEVHHTTFLTALNIYDTDVTLNPNRLKLLCYPCHKKQHFNDHSAIVDGYVFDSEGNIIEATPPIDG